MGIVLTGKTQRTPGPTIVINCPLCDATAVAADSYEQVDRLGLFYIIPVLTMRNTFVRCGDCGRTLIAQVGIDEIDGYAPEQLSPFLVGHVSLVSKLFAVLSVLLFWAPIVGLGLGILGILTNLRTVGWPKTASIVGTVLSAMVTGTMIILLAMGA